MAIWAGIDQGVQFQEKRIGSENLLYNDIVNKEDLLINAQ